MLELGQGVAANQKHAETRLGWILLQEIIILLMMQPGGFSLPALVGEADGPGVLRLARVLLLGGLLPLGDDVTHLVGGSFEKKKRNETAPLNSQQDDPAVRRADLDVSQQAVLQLLAAGVVSVQAERRRLPHGRLLVEAALELLHRGGSVEAHHLRGSEGTETTVTAGVEDKVVTFDWSSELIQWAGCESARALEQNSFHSQAWTPKVHTVAILTEMLGSSRTLKKMIIFQFQTLIYQRSSISASASQ